MYHLILEVDQLLLAGGITAVLVVEKQDHLVERWAQWLIQLRPKKEADGSKLDQVEGLSNLDASLLCQIAI